jgi:hypothetical protein
MNDETAENSATAGTSTTVGTPTTVEHREGTGAMSTSGPQPATAVPEFIDPHFRENKPKTLVFSN